MQNYLLNHKTQVMNVSPLDLLIFKEEQDEGKHCQHRERVATHVGQERRVFRHFCGCVVSLLLSMFRHDYSISFGGLGPSWSLSDLI